MSAAAGSAEEGLQDDLEVQRQHQKRLVKQVEEQETALQTLRKQLLDVQEQAVSLTEKLEDEKELASVTKAEHMRQLAAAEERVFQAAAAPRETSEESASEEVRGLHAQIANLSQQLLRKQQHVLELQAERSALRSKLDDSQANFQAMERQLADLRDTDGDDLESGYAVYGRSSSTGMSRRSGPGVSPGTVSKTKGGPRIVHEMEKLGVNAGPQVTRAVDAIDTWSLDLGRTLRTHPLIRIGSEIYLIVLHIWVFLVLSMQTHELDEGGSGMGGLDPRDFTSNVVGDEHRIVEDIAATVKKF